VDATPIYTELQKTLMDPEDTNWGPSAPPEFAAALTESAEQGAPEPRKAESRKTESGKARAGSGARSRSRRHRAED
jgi:hypothetical protein